MFNDMETIIIIKKTTHYQNTLNLICLEQDSISKFRLILTKNSEVKEETS